MKARYLRKLLNDTDYIVHVNGNKICVGSPLCHDLININIENGEIRYQLDTWREGRKALTGNSKTELLFIWDKLVELYESGELKEIFGGKDILENPLDVYTYREGEIIHSLTDEFGWPNTTDDGYLMYENTYFRTRHTAIARAIREYSAAVECATVSVEKAHTQMRESIDYLREYQGYFEKVSNLAGGGW